MWSTIRPQRVTILGQPGRVSCTTGVCSYKSSEPKRATTCMTFSELMAKTKCPFAATARVVLHPTELSGPTLSKEPSGVVPGSCSKHLIAGEENSTDLVVVPVESASLCYSIASCASLVHTLLAAMYTFCDHDICVGIRDILRQETHTTIPHGWNCLRLLSAGLVI